MTKFTESGRVRITDMASKRRERQDGQDVNLCFEARSALGLSQTEFGKRTGRTLSMIHRREKGELGIPGSAQVLYRLILLMVHYGMKGVVMRTSEAISEGSASEERLMADLTVACVEKGSKELVRLATTEINPLEFEPSEALADGFDPNESARFLEILQQDLQRFAARDPENAEKLLELAGDVSGLKFGFLALGAKKRAEEKSGSKDDPGGGET